MDRQWAVIAYRPQAHQANRVQRYHGTGRTKAFEQVNVAAHHVNFVGDIEGIHHLAPCLLRGFVQNVHHQFGAVVKRTCGAVPLQLVILDEIDAGPRQITSKCGGLFGT